MFSKPLLGTNIKEPKMSWISYIWNSCIIQGWYNCWYAFKNWADLMGDNYTDYALLVSDDPLEQCILYFWDSLEDEIYPKHFLDSLLQMSYDIETGKEKVIPMDEVMMNRLKDLVKDVDLEDTFETGTLDPEDD
jgi:hypothetical protein